MGWGVLAFPENCGPDKAQFEPPSYVIRYSNGVATLP